MFRNLFFFNSINKILIRLPVPSNISYFWNFSSSLSIMLSIQISSSIFLSMLYISESNMSFKNLNFIMMDSNLGWALRFMHTMSASVLMMIMYLHLLRSLYYKRYANKFAWLLSVILLICMMSTAFLSYVLPWSQMSFWGATVITNLLTTIPVFGESIVMWLWGSFNVSGFTLTRFFTFHFILPFMIILFSIFHLLMIHSLSASNTLGTASNLKIDFWPFFGYKDLMSFMFLFLFFFMYVFFFPYNLMDSENFIMANSSVTPLHIKPEWYFLFAYAMLRSIPNKAFSVITLVFSIVIFFLLPYSKKTFDYNFSFIYKIVYFTWLMNFLLLTWLGSCPVKLVFNFFSQICSLLYFFLLLLIMII